MNIAVISRYEPSRHDLYYVAKCFQYPDIIGTGNSHEEALNDFHNQLREIEESKLGLYEEEAEFEATHEREP